jgi:RHS repeat-associated protein
VRGGFSSSGRGRAGGLVRFPIAYDTAGRANSYTDQQGRNTQVQYDRVGNRLRLQWPANTNGTSAYYVTYNYDSMNRLTEIDQNGSPFSPLAKYQWDALSRLSLITYGDGTTDSYSQYDASDNLLALTQSFTGGQNNVSFGYMWRQNHQLSSTSVNNGAFQYIPSTGTVNYGAANVDNGYTSAGGVSFTYDTNRNLTYDGFNTLSYDVENRLVQAQNSFGTNQYQYDPLGHRKQKLTGSGVTTQFVLAGADEIADYSGTGMGTPLQLTVRGVGGLPVASITPGTRAVIYYHHDGLGSSVAATATGQSGAEAFTYGPFGEPGAGNVLTYQFGGYRLDTETGLYYVKARYYSPTWGRFLQTDPIGLAGGRNLYAYVGNDPINRSDPKGTCGVFILNCIGAAIGGVSAESAAHWQDITQLAPGKVH